MTRFPPNIEQLSVKHDFAVMWLVARRNDVELRFPLNEEDRRYLWPAPGSADTELGVLMEPEVDHGEAEVYTRVQA